MYISEGKGICGWAICLLYFLALTLSFFFFPSSVMILSNRHMQLLAKRVSYGSKNRKIIWWTWACGVSMSQHSYPLHTFSAYPIETCDRLLGHHVAVPPRALNNYLNRIWIVTKGGHFH